MTASCCPLGRSIWWGPDPLRALYLGNLGYPPAPKHRKEPKEPIVGWRTASSPAKCSPLVTNGLFDLSVVPCRDAGMILLLNAVQKLDTRLGRRAPALAQLTYAEVGEVD